MNEGEIKALLELLRNADTNGSIKSIDVRIKLETKKDDSNKASKPSKGK